MFLHSLCWLTCAAPGCAARQRRAAQSLKKLGRNPSAAFALRRSEDFPARPREFLSRLWGAAVAGRVALLPAKFAESSYCRGCVILTQIIQSFGWCCGNPQTRSAGGWSLVNTYKNYKTLDKPCELIVIDKAVNLKYSHSRISMLICSDNVLFTVGVVLRSALCLGRGDGGGAPGGGRAGGRAGLSRLQVSWESACNYKVRA